MSTSQIPLRRPDGRFATVRNPIALYEIVREVASVAAERDVDRLKDPRAVSQAAWNSARIALEPTFGLIPLAHEVSRQLSDRRGRPFPWRDLLELVFDETQDIAAVHRQRLAHSARPITPEKLEWALLLVCQHVQKQTLLPYEYAEGREAVIAAAPKRRRDFIARKLPTENQILSHCGGSWDRALEIGGREPRARMDTRPRQALPVVDSIVFYYGKLGHLPTSGELDEFAAREGFSKASHKGRPWHERIREAITRIAELGWPEPPTYGAPAPSSWRPLMTELLAAPTRGKRGYSHREVLEAMREFVLWLNGKNPTDRRWREYSRGRDGVPALGVIKAHGGLRELIREAARPDWEERAGAWIDSRLVARAAKPKRSAEELLAGRASNQQARSVLDVLRSRSGFEATAKELADALDWTVQKVRGWLEVVRAAGLVEQTQAYGRSKKQSYRLTVKGRLA